jgi:hypothetical protein
MTGRKNEERNTEKQTYKQKHVLYIFTVTLRLQWLSAQLGVLSALLGASRVSLRSPSV